MSPNFIPKTPANYIDCLVCNEGMVENWAFDPDGNLQNAQFLCPSCFGTGVLPEPDPQDEGDLQADLTGDAA